MNGSTLIGFLLSSVIFGLAVFTSTGNIMIFFDPHAILIVIGGTISVSCVCFSLPKLLVLFKVFLNRMVSRKNLDYNPLYDEIVMLSDAARRSRDSFEGAIENIRTPFLKDAAEILFWKEADISPTKLRYILDLRVSTHYERYLDQANMFRTIAKFPPVFGLMGTTLGMIVLLQGLGGNDAADTIGPSMSIALVATLYGIVVANYVFVPISENLTRGAKEDLIARRMVVESILLIDARMPTRFVEETVKSLLLPGERKLIPSKVASEVSAG
jgi:chemotaxis protein MotA